jgi:hypothetical protein
MPRIASTMPPMRTPSLRARRQQPDVLAGKSQVAGEPANEVRNPRCGIDNMVAFAAESPDALVGQGLDVAGGIATRLRESGELEYGNDLLLDPAAAWTRWVSEQFLDVLLGRLLSGGARTHFPPMPALSLSMQTGSRDAGGMTLGSSLGAERHRRLEAHRHGRAPSSDRRRRRSEAGPARSSARGPRARRRSTVGILRLSRSPRSAPNQAKPTALPTRGADRNLVVRRSFHRPIAFRTSPLKIVVSPSPGLAIAGLPAMAKCLSRYRDTRTSAQAPRVDAKSQTRAPWPCAAHDVPGGRRSARHVTS